MHFLTAARPRCGALLSFALACLLAACGTTRPAVTPVAVVPAASAPVEVEWAKEVAPKGLDGAMLVKEVRAIGAKHMK